MTRRPVWLLAGALLALAAARADAQPREQPKPKPIPADGTEVFRWLLHNQGVTPLRQQDLLPRPDLSGVIVIILGDTRFDTVNGRRPLDYAVLAIRQGGAALVASDTPLEFDRGFTTFDRARVAVGQVVCDDGECYDRRPACPFVVPEGRPKSAGPEWDLFDGLTRVATNTTSALYVPSYSGEFRHRLAGFPANITYGQFSYDANNPLPRQFAFAAGNAGRHPDTDNRYRFLALADPSVFINQMLLAPDRGGGAPDNLTFAYRTVKFLSEEGGEPRRTECLFIQNGVVVNSFNDLDAYMKPQVPPVGLPNVAQLIDRLQDKLVDAGDQLIDKVQENDVPNRALLGRSAAGQERNLRRILQGLLWVGVIALLVLLRSMWRARQPTDTPAPPPAGRPPPPKGTGSGGVFDRRQRELARRNNLYEPVRAAVREMFAAAGAPPGAGPRLPKVVISDMVRRADTLRDALRDLWRIAHGRPSAVTVQQWNVLEPLFERVRQAHADGKWRFVAADPDAAAARSEA